MPLVMKISIKQEVVFTRSNVDLCLSH